MSLEPVLIGGKWRQSEHAAGEFQAVDPATKAASREIYPVSSSGDVERACEAAGEPLLRNASRVSSTATRRRLKNIASCW
jgi:hypothetical protein